MLIRVATTGTDFTRAISLPGVDRFTVSTTVRSTYHPSRKRSSFANAAIEALCAVVNTVTVAGKVDRLELFEKYDYKLWSYEDHLTRFTLATVPPVIALAAIYVTFRITRGLRLAFSQ